MDKYFNYWLLFFVFCMLTSCFSAKPILRMRPTTHHDFSQKNDLKNALINDKEDSIQVSLQFSHYDSYDDHLVMNVEIANLKQNNDINIYPHKMRYKVFNDSTLSKYTDYLRAKDPYIKLAELERKQAQVQANKKSAGFWLVLGAVVGITGTIVKATGEIKEATQNPQHRDRQQSQKNRNTKELGNSMENLGITIMETSANSSVRNEIKDQVVEAEKHYWQNFVLHSTTLSPQQNIKGNVHFFLPDKKSKGIKYCVFEIPIGDKLYKFIFCKKWIYPDESIENAEF